MSPFCCFKMKNYLKNVVQKMVTILLAIIIIGDLSHCVLVTKPRNIIGFTGISPSVSMNCSSDRGSNAIVWYFTLFDTSNNVSIAVGAQVSQNYVNTFWIDQPNSSASNLILYQPTNLTAGTYTCSDGTAVASAQHSVYTSENIGGKSNITNGRLTNGDVFWYSCSFCIYGNSFIIPQLYLYLNYPTIAYNFTNPEITKIGSLTCATGRVVETATCGVLFPRSGYSVYFSAPRGNLPSNSDTNAPDRSWGVTFISPINVTCVPTDKNMTISGLIGEHSAYYGAELICNVASNTPVNYTWTDVANGNSTTGQRITVWRNATYRCNASTVLNGITYSASKTLFNLNLLRFSLSGSPLFGPIAGGTRIRFSIYDWSEDLANISSVYIGTKLTAIIENIDRESNVMTAVTPNVTEDVVQQPLQIVIEFTPGPFNVTTDQHFVYRSNPEILRLDPSSFIVTGGTSVSVYGISLSSVSNPLIQATVAVRRINDAESSSKTTVDSCLVLTSDGAEMVCNMPPVNIPTDFMSVLDSNYFSNETSNRATRNSSVLEVIGPNGFDRATVYLGFILDGYKKYENINNALPNTEILFFSAPEINSSQKVFEYNPETEELFLIKGQHLTRGCRLTDYVVRVGNDNCQTIDLQDNALSCRLPKTEPQLTQNDTIFCGEHLSVRVDIGYKEYQYSCLKYTSSLNQALIIGLCVGVGGSLLVVVVVVSVFFCCRKCRNDRSKENIYSSAQRHSTTDDHFYEQPDQHSETNGEYSQSIELE